MILTFKETVLLDTRITFGGVTGCGVFGQVADTWKAIMLAKGTPELLSLKANQGQT
jgi:hypothetical protein